MKIYNVFSKSSSNNKDALNIEMIPYQKHIFVEDGFFVLGFILNSLWLLINKVWFFAIASLAIQIMLLVSVSYNILSDILAYKLLFLHALIVSFFAKNWYIAILKKNGYKLIDLVAAQNIDEARLYFYKKQSIDN
jgi:hypothetical protein